MLAATGDVAVDCFVLPLIKLQKLKAEWDINSGFQQNVGRFTPKISSLSMIVIVFNIWVSSVSLSWAINSIS